MNVIIFDFCCVNKHEISEEDPGGIKRKSYFHFLSCVQKLDNDTAWYSVITFIANMKKMYS